jgi:hypothetical protein
MKTIPTQPISEHFKQAMTANRFLPKWIAQHNTFIARVVSRRGLIQAKKLPVLCSKMNRNQVRSFVIYSSLS